jgi:hypothetical protein
MAPISKFLRFCDARQIRVTGRAAGAGGGCRAPDRSVTRSPDRSSSSCGQDEGVPLRWPGSRHPPPAPAALPVTRW